MNPSYIVPRLMRSNARVAALVAATIIVAATGISGQTVHRLSPRTGDTALLPLDIRIQSADSSGGIAFAIWGTLDLDSAGFARRCLRMQRFADGTPTGPSRVVHSEAARPTRHVRVMSSSTGAVVIWYDNRRRSPGAYARRFGSDGQPVGDEWLIAPGTVSDFVAYPGLPGITLIVRDRQPPILIHDDGTIDRREFPRERFAIPHVIRSDSSLVTLEHDTVVVRPHFLSDEIRARIPVPDAAITGPAGWILSSNSQGQIVVTYLIRWDSTIGTCSASGALILQRVLVGDSTLADRRQIARQYLCHTEIIISTISVTAVTRRRSEGGWIVNVVLSIYTKPPQSMGGTSYDAVEYRFNCYGELAPALFVRPGDLPVRRVRSDTVSLVRVATFPDSTDLSWPIPKIQTGTEYRQPAITEDAASRFVAWSQANGAYPIFALSRWERSGIVAPVAATGAMVGTDTSADDRSQYTRDGVSRLITSGGRILLASRIDQLGFGRDGSYRSVKAWLYLGTDTSWSTMYRLSPLSVPSGDFLEIPFLSSSADTILMAQCVDPTSTVFRRCLASGQMIDSTRVSRVRLSQLVGYHNLRWYVCDGDRMIAVDTSRRDTTMLPAQPAGEQCVAMLPDGSLLRAAFLSKAPILDLQRISLDGAVLATNQFGVETGHHLSVAVNGRDSTIALIYATDAGVVLTRVDLNLVPLAVNGVAIPSADSIAYPAGVFRDDVLQLVWEDHREGIAAIYGAELREPYSSVHGTPSTSGLILSTRPIPASDHLVVETNNGVERITILDLRGKAVWSESPGNRRRWIIDIAAVPSGVYRIVAASAARVEIRTLVIVH